MKKKLLFVRKLVVLGQTKILVSMFSEKIKLRFLRNVTRCYAKNIIVQTFSVLLSYYHRIIIVHKCSCNTRDLPCRC